MPAPPQHCAQCKWHKDGYCVASPPHYESAVWRDRTGEVDPQFMRYPQVRTDQDGPCRYFEKK